jgi:hypothetical protein
LEGKGREERGVFLVWLGRKGGKEREVEGSSPSCPTILFPPNLVGSGRNKSEKDYFARFNCSDFTKQSPLTDSL